jgi:predicted DNA-binding transcriptional regulator AlpA
MVTFCKEKAMPHIKLQDRAEKDYARLLDVHAVSEMCYCSTRHVYRLSDAGKMPRPVKLGALVRWNRSAIEAWIAAGCPAVRAATRKEVK